MNSDRRMSFVTMGQDLSLDFVKGFAIICVLLTHSLDASVRQKFLFFLWGLPAVPLFLLIQTFHTYKKGFSKVKLNISKIWKRAIRPFLIVECLIFTYYVVTDPLNPFMKHVKVAFFWGGAGPGSYYPWVYLQFALVLPLLAPVFRRMHGVSLALLFLALSIGAEVFCSVMDVPTWLYRMLFFRYIFLIYLGYILVTKGIVMNTLTIVLSIISILAVCYFEYYAPNWEPWFVCDENWRDFHWICYFYIAFAMMYVLVKIFYWLPANGLIENVVCHIGHHSFAIYIFQLFYFAVIAPWIEQLFSLIGNHNVERVLLVVVAMAVCIWPVTHFVSGKKDSVVFYRISMIVMAVIMVVVGIVWYWRPYYQPVAPIPPYHTKHPADDTLRVIMIGDSWAHFHNTLKLDSVVEERFRQVLQSDKVTFRVKGKGGASSGEIYENMSSQRAMAIDYDLEQSLQPLIDTGPDYCIISAGINDARQRRGKKYYTENYLQIIRLLLHAGIKPVIVEIPDVEVDDAYYDNTLYYRLRYRVCMYMLNTSLLGTEDYRRAFRETLQSEHLMDSVLYIPYHYWNPEGWKDSRDLYTDDHLHLNLQGYEVYDSCLVYEIAKDWKLKYSE